ncbi:flagellar assembly protein FliH [Lysinibacillus composti]|uniref:flagellar assembly protein FliH n=1 Tax=Lysinibacillus composti TaxID=720633 RepID=UPI0026B996D9
MTSLSRLIRSIKSEQQEQQTVNIQIRDLFTKTFDGEEEEQQHAEPQISLEEIYAERDQLLFDAGLQIEAQRQEFEQYRHEQLEQIEQLKMLWEEEKLVLQQQAYEQGFGQGYEEGINKANADMAGSLKMANETIEHSLENARKYIEDQEHVILDLALTASQKIIGVSLERQDELFVSIIKQGLKEAREMKEVKIYISPKYYELITSYRDELVEMFPTDVPFLIFVNEDLNDTESYIETNHGRIVVSIDSQLNELRLKLHEILDSKE